MIVGKQQEDANFLAIGLQVGDALMKYEEGKDCDGNDFEGWFRTKVLALSAMVSSSSSSISGNSSCSRNGPYAYNELSTSTSLAAG